MRRWDFIAVLLGARWPLAAHAQQPGKVRRLGVSEISSLEQPRTTKMNTSGALAAVAFLVMTSVPSATAQTCRALPEKYCDWERLDCTEAEKKTLKKAGDPGYNPAVDPIRCIQASFSSAQPSPLIQLIDLLNDLWSGQGDAEKSVLGALTHFRSGDVANPDKPRERRQHTRDVTSRLTAGSPSGAEYPLAVEDRNVVVRAWLHAVNHDSGEGKFHLKIGTDPDPKLAHFMIAEVESIPDEIGCNACGGCARDRLIKARQALLKVLSTRVIAQTYKYSKGAACDASGRTWSKECFVHLVSPIEVRVEGSLFFDHGHVGTGGPCEMRRSGWEIHPVSHICRCDLAGRRGTCPCQLPTR